MICDTTLANNIENIAQIKNIDILMSKHLERMYVEQWKCILNKCDIHVVKKSVSVST